MHAKIAKLRERPSRDRTDACKGLVTLAAVEQVPADGEHSEPNFSANIDRTGGDFKAGLIRGCSLCTQGEALGHSYYLDEEFIGQLQVAASASRGVKARFTHPSLSGDGLGTFLGRVKGCSTVTGDISKCVGDLHLSPVAHKTPDGDLAEYLMDFADSDPEAFGMSIVFEHDDASETEFLLANGAEEVEDPEDSDWYQDGRFFDLKGFKSPDPINGKNFPHARLKSLHASDVVDSPAANPQGLFHREQQFAQEADAVASFALGLTQQLPSIAALDVNPERAKGFVSRFLNAHNLKIVSKETPMSEEKPAPETTEKETPVVETPAPEKPAVETPAAETPATPPPSPAAEPAAVSAQSAADPRAECKRFMATFGANGPAWFAEGLSFEDAQTKHNELLAKENKELKGRLSTVAGSLGEEKPVSFDADAIGDKNRKVAKFSHLGPRLAAFAAGIKLPDGPAAKTN